MSETETITEKKCPKCKGGMPLYRTKVPKGWTVVINKREMRFSVETVLHRCVRCRGVWSDDGKVKL